MCFASTISTRNQINSFFADTQLECVFSASCTKTTIPKSSQGSIQTQERHNLIKP